MKLTVSINVEIRWYTIYITSAIVISVCLISLPGVALNTGSSLLSTVLALCPARIFSDNDVRFTGHDETK